MGRQFPVVIRTLMGGRRVTPDALTDAGKIL